MHARNHAFVHAHIAVYFTPFLFSLAVSLGQARTLAHIEDCGVCVCATWCRVAELFGSFDNHGEKASPEGGSTLEKGDDFSSD